MNFSEFLSPKNGKKHFLYSRWPWNNSYDEYSPEVISMRIPIVLEDRCQLPQKMRESAVKRKDLDLGLLTCMDHGVGVGG